MSAPTMNSRSFQPDQIEISGGFTREQATELANLLELGTLPLTLRAR